MIQLMQGDCLEVMGCIPSGSIDLILCDLPYGSTACKWDSIIDLDRLWAVYKRTRKTTTPTVLFCSQPFTSRLGASNLADLKYSWAWEKSRPTDFLQAKHKPLKGFEDILVFYKERPVYNPQDTVAIDRTVKNTGTKARDRQGKKENNDQTFHHAVTGADANDCYRQKVTNYPRGIVKFAQESQNFHPTQKPVALMEYLIKTYTNPGDTVLDNCMGSGTTGVACVNTCRNFIGIEKDPSYFEICKQRIKGAEVVTPAPREPVDNCLSHNQENCKRCNP